jgi:hypothetical protein
VLLNFDNGVSKELKWSSIVWSTTPSSPPAGSGAIVTTLVGTSQPIPSNLNPALPVPTQPRPQAPPAPPRGVIAQHLPHPNTGSGASPQHPTKGPHGHRAPTGHPYYGQTHPQSHLAPGAPYTGYPSHPYPTPSSSSNNTPHSINFMHYQPPPLKSKPNPTVNAYYRPRPALDAEARMQQKAHFSQYAPAPHAHHQIYPQHLPQAPLSPVSPTRNSSTQRPGDAPAPTMPTVTKNEAPVAIQLPTPQQIGDTPP